jgi:hypothetical protein
MKYTLDASVAMNWVPPEPDTPKAVRLRNKFREGLHDLIAPDIFVPEIAHGLTRDLHRCRDSKDHAVSEPNLVASEISSDIGRAHTPAASARAMASTWSPARPARVLPIGRRSVTTGACIRRSA